MSFKKFIAFAVVATMVAANTVTAFADDGVTGAGIVEYDDSIAIKYDQVEVPVLNASTYNFTMDPTGLLKTGGFSDGATYDADSTVYFKTVKDKAFVEAADVGLMYTKKYSVAAPEDGKYKAIATGTVTEGVATVTAIDLQRFVWVPDTAYANGSGSSGKYLEITADNIENFFDLSTSATDGKLDATFRSDYKMGENVCSGVVYSMAGEAFGGSAADAKAKLVDSDATPLSTFFTIEDDVLTGVEGIYSDSACTTAVTKDAFDYTKATSQYAGNSDTVYVKNLSTKDKTITAKVTLNDATGLEVGDASFTGLDAKAAIYVAAYKDNTATALTKDAEGVISAEITADLDGADESSAITYQADSGTNKLGGHTYKRYSAPGVTYNDNSFKIVAKVNTKTNDNKDAWDKYFEDATAAPSINIVYTVTNTNAEDDEEEEEEVVTPTAGTAALLPYDNAYWLGLKGASGASFTKAATSVVVNTKDVTANAQLIGGYIAIKASDLTAAGVNTTEALNATYVVDGVTYTATYQAQ